MRPKVIDRQELCVSYVSVEDLRPASRNARTHSAEQIGQLVGLMKQFGFTSPILADEQLQIIAGHGRLEAAQMLGMDEVPVIVLSGLTTAQKRALALADNRVAQNSGWDDQLLRLELKDLNDDGEIDLEALGFDKNELLQLLQITGNTPPDGEGSGDATSYSIVVEVLDKREQKQVLQRLVADGYKCHPVTV